MKISFLFFVLLTALASSLVSAAEMKFVLPPETASLKPGPGAELAAAQCLVCHSADYISTQPKLARAAWNASLLKMRQKYGATIQTNTFDRLVQYLVTNYGTEAGKTKP